MQDPETHFARSAGGGAWCCHAPRGAGTLASRRRRRKRGWCASLPGNGPDLGEATAGGFCRRRADAAKRHWTHTRHQHSGQRQAGGPLGRVQPGAFQYSSVHVS